jgi:hypothetical protein
MTRFGTAIRARNPLRSGSKIHQVAVEQEFGRSAVGFILPLEAAARTMCGRRAIGFVVCSYGDVGYKTECRMCP